MFGIQLANDKKLKLHLPATKKKAFLSCWAQQVFCKLNPLGYNLFAEATWLGQQCSLNIHFTINQLYYQQKEVNEMADYGKLTTSSALSQHWSQRPRGLLCQQWSFDLLLQGQHLRECLLIQNQGSRLATTITRI